MELVKYCRAAPYEDFGKQADIYLQAAPQPEAYFVLALGQKLRDRWISSRVFDCSGNLVFVACRTGDQQVKIAYGFPAATQRSRRHHLFNPRELLQIKSHSFGRGFRVI